MPNTFTLIASTTLGSAQTQIDFSSIPNTYTDLCLKLSLRTSNATNGEVANISFNGSSASISVRTLYGNNTTATSATSTSWGVWVNGNSTTASTFGNAEIYLPNYAGSTNKSWSADSVTELNGTDNYANLFAGLWSNTAAINRVTLTAGSSANFVVNSTAYLYGVKNA